MSASRLIHYIVVGLLALCAIAYWWLKPPTADPITDPAAAEAMAIVQTHRAESAPTLRQALAKRVEDMAKRGIGVRMGTWSVEHRGGEVYVVKAWIREQGATQWFEREYIWEVHREKKKVVGVSLPAIDLMPRDEKGPMVGPPGLPQL